VRAGDQRWFGRGTGQERVVATDSSSRNNNIIIIMFYYYYYYYYYYCCLFSRRYNPLWLYFHSPVAGFSLLVFEVS
jgi:hypothetical protein